MEVHAGMVPLDLGLYQMAIRDTTKIAAKRQDDLFKCYLNRFRDEDVGRQRNSFRKSYEQSNRDEDSYKNRNIFC